MKIEIFRISFGILLCKYHIVKLKNKHWTKANNYKKKNQNTIK